MLQVEWTRNNLTLQIRDENKQVQIDPSNVFEKHSLELFVQGKQEEGNYTCIDSETGKQSKDMTVLLSVDGGWSAWRSSDECLSENKPSYVLEYRECNNPVPVNGGRVCAGKQKKLKCIQQYITYVYILYPSNITLKK